MTIEVTFTPADFAELPRRDLSATTCVVLDILRATTSMTVALANGAEGIIPVAEIAEAVAIRRQQPEVLLGGERLGLRIRAAQTGGVDFDFGNSPREYTAEKVRGHTIVSTTTNGTRALRSCAQASQSLIASFLNLGATAGHLRANPPKHLILVCSGTHEETGFEDVLAAGALCEALASAQPHFTDSAWMARQIYQAHAHDLLAAMPLARNARRLLSLPELAGDVAFSLRRDIYSLVAGRRGDGSVGILTPG